MKYLRKFENNAAYESATLDLPNVAYCKEENQVHYNPIHDYSNNYLTFVIKTSGTFKIYPDDADNVYYSLNDGETWVDFSEGGEITVSTGDKLMWKGTLSSGGRYWEKGQGSTVHFDIQGNIMSLAYGDNFKGQTDLTDKVFNSLFSEWHVESAENLILPATTLEIRCYQYMFGECASLVTAPRVLPATTLANECYGDMFYHCTSLTTAPELPATTLAEYCYSSMFEGCTSLVNAPELPATTLVNGCYGGMFEFCTSLNYIKAMFTTSPSIAYTPSWVNGVASSGTFVKNAAATWDVTGANGIPSGWTVETANE